VRRAAKEAKGEPIPDDDLLEIVTGLVEEPYAVRGSFDASFLELPPEVLVSEMRGHQKYFAVRDPQTKRILPDFVAVSNTKVRDAAVSRRGYERVLRARLSDGKFFFDEDRKIPLAARNERLGRTVFVQGLGTQMERVARIGELARWLHGATGKGDPRSLSRAAEVLKSDLATGMVGEFPELQGVMGRVYALHEGLPQEIADAIFEHYLPRGAEELLPQGDTGALLGIADRIDQLAGIFSIGKAPTGTSDAFGLRRAAIGLLRIALHRRYRFDLREALGESQRILRSQIPGQGKGAREDVADKVWAFVQDRLSVHLRDSGAPDSIQAILGTSTSDVVALADRLSALTEVRQKNRADFESTAATFKRIANILAQAKEKKIAPMAFDPGLLRKDEPSETALAEALSRSRDQVGEALEDESYLSAYAVLAELRPAVDRFFDEVMVMHEDAKIRDNRLALLRSLHELFSPLADFSRLQVERTGA